MCGWSDMIHSCVLTSCTGLLCVNLCRNKTSWQTSQTIFQFLNCATTNKFHLKINMNDPNQWRRSLLEMILQYKFQIQQEVLVSQLKDFVSFYTAQIWPFQQLEAYQWSGQKERTQTHVSIVCHFHVRHSKFLHVYVLMDIILIV